MDLDFTPEQQAFRADIRAWVAANLPEDIAHKVHNALRLHARRPAALGQDPRQQGLAGLRLAEGVRRPGLGRDRAAPVRGGMRAGRRAAHRAVRAGDGGAGDHGVRLARAAEALPARHRVAARSGGARATASRARAPTSPRSRRAPMREGDKYIVNGQKTWTTLGQYGDWIFCLVRTSHRRQAADGHLASC